MKLSQIINFIFFPVHVEGKKIGFFILITSLVLGLLFGTWLLNFGLALCLFVLFFFRDPERITPNNKDVIVAAADGKIININHEEQLPKGLDPKYFADPQQEEQKVTKISIFLNVTDVHINRYPAQGQIISMKYVPGKFINAELNKASEHNERKIYFMKLDHLANEHGNQEKPPIIAFVQIAGFIARRIVSFCENGDHGHQGERFGLIKFGSRVDIYIPEQFKICAKVGQTMVGGETVIAINKIKSNDQ